MDLMSFFSQQALPYRVHLPYPARDLGHGWHLEDALQDPVVIRTEAAPSGIFGHMECK